MSHGAGPVDLSMAQSRQYKALLSNNRAMTTPLLLMGRLTYKCMGFHAIEYTGPRASAQEAPVLVAAPHSSFFDTIVFFAGIDIPCPIARIEQRNVRVLGSTYSSVNVSLSVLMLIC